MHGEMLFRILPQCWLSKEVFTLKVTSPAAEEAQETEDQGDGQSQGEQDQQAASKRDDFPPEAPAPDGSDAADETSFDTDPNEPDSGGSLAQTVLEAAQAAIPPGLLAALKLGEAARSRTQSAGRSGATQKSQMRGRPLGALGDTEPAGPHARRVGRRGVRRNSRRPVRGR